MASLVTGSLNIRVRILDPEKRLLFVLNRETRKIELIPIRAGRHQKARRKKYFISMDVLNSLLEQEEEKKEKEYVIEEEEDA